MFFFSFIEKSRQLLGLTGVSIEKTQALDAGKMPKKRKKMEVESANQNQMTYKCGRCGEVFEVMASLVDHMSSIHGRKPSHKLQHATVNENNLPPATTITKITKKETEILS